MFFEIGFCCSGAGFAGTIFGEHVADSVKVLRSHAGLMKNQHISSFAVFVECIYSGVPAVQSGGRPDDSIQTGEREDTGQIRTGLCGIIFLCFSVSVCLFAFRLNLCFSVRGNILFLFRRRSR